MSNIFTKPFRPLDWAATPHDFSSDNQLGVHASETTQRYIYGTRYLTWNGTVWKYSLAGAICYTHRLNFFWNTITSDTNGIDYSVLTANQSAGDREITLTNGTTSAIAEDYLAGGIVIIVPTEGATDREVMTRTIIGNDAAATSGECRMFLDAPLETAVTTSNYAYAMPSNYSNIRYSTDSAGTRSAAGLAGTYAASGENFWLQTYGPCNMAYQTTYVGKTAYYRNVHCRHDGSGDIEANSVESGGSVVSDQVVGFGMDNNGDANGTTNLMLTISY